MSKIGPLMGHPEETVSRSPDPDWPLPTWLMGLEFEFEGVKSAPSCLSAYYENDVDHSLRNNGREFSFRTPLFGMDATNAISLMCAEAVKHKYICSSRCGFHVHMDARKLEHWQLVHIVTIYCIVESLLYKYAGDNRAENNHCVPFYRSSEVLSSIGQYINTKEVQPILSKVLANTERYWGLNLNALAKFGSLEFRQLRVTTDVTRIRTWIKMLMLIFKAGMSLTEVSQTAVLQKASALGPQGFLHWVFGEQPAVRDILSEIATSPNNYSTPWVWMYEGVDSANAFLFNHIGFAEPRIQASMSHDSYRNDTRKIPRKLKP